MAPFAMNDAYGQQHNACDIITQPDVTKILGFSVSPGISRATMMPAGQSCRYTYQMNGTVYGITVRFSTDTEIKEEGINNSAADLMSRQKQARVAHTYAATTFKKIAGITDTAFWNGTDLWVLKGDTLIIVKSYSYLPEAFKNKDEAKKTAEQQDLQISLDIAEVIISRLWSFPLHAR